MNVIFAAGILSTEVSADNDEIKRAWRILASRWHPDRGGDHEAMQKINAAKDYLLSLTQAARRAEKKRLARQAETIANSVQAERDAWEARQTAKAKAKASPEPEPPVTNKRRAAAWEARNKDKVRAQTSKRVKEHRARNPEQYREYMREYMKARRAKQ